tara:strand:+ start:852 stop:1859 length:1008 start_codon:yes stop_codon:yes gene_type:complete
MPYQELYIDQSVEIEQERFGSALRQFEPGNIDTYLGYADQAYMYSPAAFAVEYFSSFQDETPIAEENWNESHPLYNDGALSWNEGLTEGQAIVDKRVTERERDVGMLLRNTDPWSPVALAGTLGMNLGSWENWIPIASWMGHFNKIKNIAPAVDFIGTIDGLVPVVGGTAKIPLSASKQFGLRVADATISESIFQMSKATFNSGRGKDTDALQSAIEVALATVSGGVLSSFTFAHKIKEIPLGDHFKNMSIRINEMRDGIHARYFDKGKYTEPELNRVQVLADLQKRSDNLDGDVRLEQDASKERVKSYAQTFINDAKALGNKVLETYKCIKIRG